MTADEALKRLASMPRYTSGSKEIDEILGGGYRAGRLLIVYGRSNSGKSQLAMQAVLFAARQKTRSLYIDTEGAFRPERIEEMARSRGWQPEPLLNRIVYFRCDSATMQAETVRQLSLRKETADCGLVVVDTLTKNFTLDLPGSDNMPGRQGALDAHLSEMSRDAFLHGRAYLLTNRVTFDRANLDIGIGGSTVAQLVHDSVHLSREGGMIRVNVSGTRRSLLVSVGAPGIGR